MAKRKRLTFDAVFGQETPDVVAEAGPHVAAAPPVARVAAESSAQAALAEVSEALASARAEGRLVLRLPLAQVEAEHLVRDRIGLDADEMEPLVTSIRAYGQRTPVEVTEIAPGRYGLISGWRRMQALGRLHAETGEDRFSEVLALVRRPDSAAAAYVAMVEENEIRLGLSYYERARIAARAVELGVFETEKQALQRLFASASRARRSKIGSFLTIWRHLDGALRFPAAIPERLGLALEKALQIASAEQRADLIADLREAPAPDASAEQARLSDFIAGRTVRKKAATGSDLVPERREMRPGVFLEVSGKAGKSVLTLTGPAVDPGFRAALERWLAGEAPG